MESRSKKCKTSEGVVVVDSRQDRLSEMPDGIILHILSFMTTLDAVKTMLLRRFGNIWTFVPVIRFDLGEYCCSMVSDDDYSLNYNEAFPGFVRFVRNVLLLHRRSTIDIFHLYIDSFEDDIENPKVIDDLRLWLRFAIDREVKDIYYHHSHFDELGLVQPSFVFRSQSLAILKLSGCRIDHQPRVHMGSLKKLSLINVEGSDEAFYQLITGCPSLQELVIHRGRGLQILNISAPSVTKMYLYLENVSCIVYCPSLKCLDIAGTSPSFQLDLIDVSSLQEVYVKRLPSKCSSGLATAILTQFRNVEIFVLSREAFEGLLSCLKEMNFPQNKWKRLVLKPWWNHERCLQFIIKLVESSSVNLEELIIYVEQSLGNRELLFSEVSTPCVMPLLKTTTIHSNGKCGEVQLRLAEFLLRNAVALEKLLITSKNQITAIEELNFVKQVTKFRRASANATVIFA